MSKELLELFTNVYEALNELMYSQEISCESFRKLDHNVKTQLTEIFSELKGE